jgi:hypothetical protein
MDPGADESVVAISLIDACLSWTPTAASPCSIARSTLARRRLARSYRTHIQQLTDQHSVRRNRLTAIHIWKSSGCLHASDGAVCLAPGKRGESRVAARIRRVKRAMTWSTGQRDASGWRGDVSTSRRIDASTHLTQADTPFENHDAQPRLLEPLQPFHRRAHHRPPRQSPTTIRSRRRANDGSIIPGFLRIRRPRPRSRWRRCHSGDVRRSCFAHCVRGGARRVAKTKSWVDSGDLVV